MNVEFLSTVAVIAPDPAASCELRHLAAVPGRWGLLRHAAVASRARCAQVGIEFDVGDAAAVGSAAEELEQAGYELLHERARSRGVRRSPG